MFPYIAAKQDFTKGHSCPLSVLLGLGLACISERAIRHESHLSPVSQSSFKNSTRRKKRTSFKRRTSKKGTDVSSHYVSQCTDISVSAGHGQILYVKKGKFLFPLKLEVGQKVDAISACQNISLLPLRFPSPNSYSETSVQAAYCNSVCVCYGGMYGVMCVLYITLPFSAGGKMAAVFAEACAFTTNEARAGVR